MVGSPNFNDYLLSGNFTVSASCLPNWNFTSSRSIPVTLVDSATSRGRLPEFIHQQPVIRQRSVQPPEVRDTAEKPPPNIRAYSVAKVVFPAPFAPPTMINSLPLMPSPGNHQMAATITVPNVPDHASGSGLSIPHDVFPLACIRLFCFRAGVDDTIRNLNSARRFGGIRTAEPTPILARNPLAVKTVPSFGNFAVRVVSGPPITPSPAPFTPLETGAIWDKTICQGYDQGPNSACRWDISVPIFLSVSILMASPSRYRHPGVSSIGRVLAVGKVTITQKIEARFEHVREQILAHAAFFVANGSVEATWRTYRGHRLGPYFRVRCRQRRVQHALCSGSAPRQTSIYLGRSPELAARVGKLLADLQQHTRCKRRCEELRRQVRRSLTGAKQELRRLLAQRGAVRKWFERPVEGDSRTY